MTLTTTPSHLDKRKSVSSESPVTSETLGQRRKMASSGMPPSAPEVKQLRPRPNVAGKISRFASSRKPVNRKQQQPAGSNDKRRFVTVLKINGEETTKRHLDATPKKPAFGRLVSTSADEPVRVRVQQSNVGGSSNNSNNTHAKTSESTRWQLCRRRPPVVKGNSSVGRADAVGEKTSCSISTAEEDICIYRSPGAPLGLGLRFSGGARAGDPVRALFVQNCAPGSKAASVRCSWGTGLCEGDRVLAIGGRRVDGRLTRIECVKALKESPTSVKMRIRHYFGSFAPMEAAFGKEHEDDVDNSPVKFLSTRSLHSDEEDEQKLLNVRSSPQSEASSWRNHHHLDESNTSEFPCAESLVTIDPKSPGDGDPVKFFRPVPPAPPPRVIFRGQRSRSAPSLVSAEERRKNFQTTSGSSSSCYPTKKKEVGIGGSLNSASKPIGGLTRALIARTRSSRDLPRSLLPRKRSSLFAKSHERRNSEGEYDVPRMLRIPKVSKVLTVQEMGNSEEVPPKAEIYMNLLESPELSLESGSSPFCSSSSIEETEESSSNASTVHSCLDTPCTSNQSLKNMDVSDVSGSNLLPFDLSTLLDPFEKLEREFGQEMEEKLSTHDANHNPEENRKGGKMTGGGLIASAATLGASTAPPPSQSRLPPDGHEFPPDWSDPGLTSQVRSSSNRLLLTRHDEKSVKSVRDKIALFSHHQSSEDVRTSISSSASSLLSSSGILTRAHTHDDVRFGGNNNISTNNNVKNSNKVGACCDKSVSSADLTGSSNHVTRRPRGSLATGAGGARSQSLMEMGSASQTLPKSRNTMLGEQRRRNTVAKIKDLAIPENAQEDFSSPDRISTTQPWKQQQRQHQYNGTNSPPYKSSKPFSVYSTGSIRPPSRSNSACSKMTRRNSMEKNKQISKSESRRHVQVRSDSDDGHSSSRLSSASSSSPLTSPDERKGSLIRGLRSPTRPSSSYSRLTRKDSMEQTTKSDPRRTVPTRPDAEDGNSSSRSSNASCSPLTSPDERKGPMIRGLRSPINPTRKPSREFISRRRPSIDKSPPKPNRPASRSSSFTIDERKKSFESARCSDVSAHSSQDSLATTVRRVSGDILERIQRSFSPEPEAPRSEADGGSRVNTPTPSSTSSSRKSSSVTSPTDKNSSSSRRTSSSGFFSGESSLASPDKSIEESIKETKMSRSNKFAERPKDLSLTRDSQPQPFVPLSPGGKTIRELTEKFEPRSSSDQSPPESTRQQNYQVVSSSAILTLTTASSKESSTTSSRRESSFRLGDSANSFSWSVEESTKDTWANFDRVEHRKFSVPAAKEGHVRLREKKDSSGNAAPSRPSSLIETSSNDNMIKVFEMGHLGGDHNRPLSNSTSRGSSQADLLMESSKITNSQQHHQLQQPLRSPQPRQKQQRQHHQNLVASCTTTTSSSRELLEAFGSKEEVSSTRQSGSTRRCVSVHDIRRAFEKAELSLAQAAASHQRVSSIDSSGEENNSSSNGHTPQYYGSVSSLLSGQTSLKDHYGSISSLASSTSLISPQELQGLIDEANQSLEESGTPSHEIMVIVLHREFTSGSIGITLAGGADYESKDITVHKVIPGTLADRDGRIQKGDRVLSINGRSTKGVTHREALSILKAPRAEVVLVLSRSRSVTPADGGPYAAAAAAVAAAAADNNYAATYNYINMTNRPPKILESPLDSKSLLSDLKFVDVPRGPPTTVVLKKEGTGLGFSLEGGKDSPLGDRPLTIKKIFTGGAADKTKVLSVGDEILSVNSTDCTRMSRIEAWNFMKKLSDGTATIVVRKKLVKQQQHKEHIKETKEETKNIG